MQSLILASSSPRRIELLEGMGIAFDVIAPEIDENAAGDVSEVVALVAKQKAWHIAQHHPTQYVLGADTLVSLGDAILGKPADEEDAFRMLKMLQGKWHEVHSGVCLYVPGKIVPDVRRSVTRVNFLALTDAEIRAYVLSGEPKGKAGAYALQGRAGMFVTEIVGSFSNVIGLPTAVVRDMLKVHGYPHFQ